MHDELSDKLLIVSRRRFVVVARRAQTSLKRGLVEEGQEATVIAESRLLANFSKPNPFVPTQLLTLQDEKVGCG